jgi:hypothetical protein
MKFGEEDQGKLHTRKQVGGTIKEKMGSGYANAVLNFKLQICQMRALYVGYSAYDQVVFRRVVKGANFR